MEDLKTYISLFWGFSRLTIRFALEHLAEHVAYKRSIFYSKLMGKFIYRPKLFKYVAKRSVKLLGESLKHGEACDRLKAPIEELSRKMESIEFIYNI